VCFVGNALPQMALKRLICISKAEGNLSEAITRLNTYVRQFAGDIAAVWYLASVRLFKTCNAPSDVILAVLLWCYRNDEQVKAIY
jgi:hypothetical protein